MWCVCARGKRNLAGDASEIETGNGDVCAATRRLTVLPVLHKFSYTIRTRVSCNLVPGAAYLVPGIRYIQAQPHGTESEVGQSVSRGKGPCGQGLPHHGQVYKQSNAFPMRRRMRSAVSASNVDLLRSTTLRGNLHAEVTETPLP